MIELRRDTAELQLDGDTVSWLRRALSGCRIARATKLPGGWTNLTAVVTTTGGERYVLRRYLESASAVHRNSPAVEAALADRLAGTGLVPQVVAVDHEGRATGHRLLLYRFVEGLSLEQALRFVPDSETSSIGGSIGSALARISSVQFNAPGNFADATLAVHNGQDQLFDLPRFVQRCLDDSIAPLSGPDRKMLERVAGSYVPYIRRVAGERRLVHGDFNPKNVVIRPCGGDWEVAGVVDWEFALSGSSLFDVGNMLRFSYRYPPQFARAFLTQLKNHGGSVPEDWREISLGLDLFALTDMITHSSDATYRHALIRLVRRHFKETIGRPPDPSPMSAG